MVYQLPRVNKSVIDLIKADVENATCGHAYLFEGEAGAGKRETAAYFAAAILCQAGTDKPCGQCESCVQAMSRNNPDIRRLALGDISDKKSVGADDIRKIISDVYTKPFKASKKVYIIEDGDALTVQAQNAMLKVLEEPPEYAVFIICTTNAELILSTVRSRSRLVHFAPLSIETVLDYVIHQYPHMADRAGVVAAFSGGNLARADFMCSNQDVYALRDEAIEFSEKLLFGDNEEEIFNFCEVFEEHRKDKSIVWDTTALLLDFMLSFFTDLLYVFDGAQSQCINKDKLGEIRRVYERVSYERIYNAAQSVLESKKMLLRYVSHKAVIMKLALDIFYTDQL